jgi:pseudaminic acid cytidylyltransferase
MDSSQNAICIIPARGGSKRIPRKNIRDFHGKPVIAYSIQAALESNLFDVVMVSTDDEEIAFISKEYGAIVPFLRSLNNSDDFTGTGDVMFEVLKRLESEGLKFGSACCLYATAPLVKPNRLQEGNNLLLDGSFDAVFPVGRYSSPIYRSYKRLESGQLIMNFPEYETFRSQDLPDAFYDAGQFYWFYPDNLYKLTNKNVFGLSKGAIILEDYEVQDIDLPQDWELAELKYAYMETLKSQK